MLIGVAVGLSAALAGTAPAATRVAGDDLAAGVELAGSRVVWGSTAPDGSLEVRSAVPGAAPVTLFAYGPLPVPSKQALGGLAASATHLAVVRVASRVTGRPGRASRSEVAPAGPPSAASTTLVAGPLGGPFLHVAGHRGARQAGRSCRAATDPSEPVLWGSRLAYLEVATTCTRRGPRLRDRVVVRDLARPAAAPRVVAKGTPYWAGGEPRVGLGAVRLAGRYLAWQETRPFSRDLIAAKVVDLREARIVRTIHAAPGGERGDLLEWFDVAPDGSLVVSFQKDASGHALALLDRAGRGGTVEMRPPRGTFGYEPSTSAVSYRGGRIAFVGETGRNEFGLVLARRAGNPSPLARFTEDRPVVGDPAWTGTYAAWASRRGKTTTIWRSGPHR